MCINIKFKRLRASKWARMSWFDAFNLFVMDDNVNWDKEEAVRSCQTLPKLGSVDIVNAI